MFTPCDPTDIPALATMLRGLHPRHLAHVPPRFHDASGAIDLEAFLAGAMTSGAQLRAYRVEGVPRGYLMWRWRAAEALASENAQRRALLEHIWVEPSWRRRGLARRLLSGFEAEVAGQGAGGWIATLQAACAPSLALMQGAGARGVVAGLEKRFHTPA